MKKVKMLITTDDLNQTDWSLFKYFDKLKEEFPDFRVLAFFTPFWKEDISKFESHIVEVNIKKDFLDFLLKRKEWLSLGMHGLMHHTAEFSEDFKSQQAMFAKSSQIRNYLCSKGIQYQPACKPPFYKFNQTTFELAPIFGFNTMYLQQGIIDFESGRFIMRNKGNIIDSHVSIGCPMPDRIDKFYPRLRRIFRGEIEDRKEYHYTKNKE